MRLLLFISLLSFTLSCSRPTESSAPPAQQQEARATDPPAVGRFVTMEDPIVKEYIVADVVPAPPGSVWRWTLRNPTFRFRMKQVENLRFHADFTVQPTALKATGPVTISWVINDHLLAKETHSAEGFKKIEKPVPAEWLRSDVENIVSAEIDKLYTTPEGDKFGFIISNIGFID